MKFRFTHDGEAFIAIDITLDLHTKVSTNRGTSTQAYMN